MRSSQKNKIRMLQVNRGIYYAHDLYLKGFIENDIEVILFAISDGKKHKEIPGLETHSIYCPKIPKPAVQGLRFIVNLINFNLQVFFLLSSTFMYLLMNRKEIDILYGNKPEGNIVASLLGKTFNKPSVSRYYGSMIHPYLEKSLYQKIRNNFAEYFSFRSKTDLTIVTKDGSCGSKCAEYFGVSKENYRIYFNGLKKIPIIKKKQSEQKITVLSLGRLHTWKRVDRLIRAIPEIIAKFSNIEFIIVGGGINKVDLEEQTRKLGIADHVRFTGHVSHDEVNGIMQKADIMCSLQDYCNFSKNVIEAMANSLCVVTSDEGSIDEMITNHVQGVIIPKNELKTRLPEVIIQLAENPQLRLKIGREARKFTDNNVWSWEERISAEVNDIRSLVK